MGNINSSAHFSRDRLDSEAIADTDLLRLKEWQLLDKKRLSEAYADAAAAGAVERKDVASHEQREALIERIRRILDSINYAPQRERFHDQLLIQLQKEMQLLTQNLDGFQHLLDARCELLAASHVAFQRTLCRLEATGRIVSSDVDDVKEFLLALLAGRTDEELGDLLSPPAPPSPYTPRPGDEAQNTVSQEHQAPSTEAVDESDSHDSDSDLELLDAARQLSIQLSLSSQTPQAEVATPIDQQSRVSRFGLDPAIEAKYLPDIRLPHRLVERILEHAEDLPEIRGIGGLMGHLDPAEGARKSMSTRTILGIGSWNPEVRDIELPAPQAEVISSFASLNSALLSPAGLHIPDGDEDPLDLSDGSSDAEISDIRNLSEAQDWRRGNGGDDNPEESSDSAPEDSFFRSIAEAIELRSSSPSPRATRDRAARNPGDVPEETKEQEEVKMEEESKEQQVAQGSAQDSDPATPIQDGRPESQQPSSPFWGRPREGRQPRLPASQQLNPPAARRSPPLRLQDVYFHAFELLDLLLEEAYREAKERLRKLDVSLDSPPPIARLLVLLQRDLLRKAASAIVYLSENPEPTIPPGARSTTAPNLNFRIRLALLNNFRAYLVKFLTRLSSVAKIAGEVLGDSACAPDTGSKFAGVRKILWNSFVGQAAPILLTTSYALAHQPAFNAYTTPLRQTATEEIALGIGPSFWRVLWRLVSDLLTNLQPIAESDAALHSLVAGPVEAAGLLAPLRSKVIESRHSYQGNTHISLGPRGSAAGAGQRDNQQVVSIQGADFLLIHFDPRCHTDRDRDILEIMTETGAPVSSPLHGPPHFWPRRPLVVPGSACIVRFTTRSLAGNSSAAAVAPVQPLWGYRCTVTGVAIGSGWGTPISATDLQLQPQVHGPMSLEQRTRLASEKAKLFQRAPSPRNSEITEQPWIGDVFQTTLRLFGRLARASLSDALPLNLEIPPEEEEAEEEEAEQADHPSSASSLTPHSEGSATPAEGESVRGGSSPSSIAVRNPEEWEAMERKYQVYLSMGFLARDWKDIEPSSEWVREIVDFDRPSGGVSVSDPSSSLGRWLDAHLSKQLPRNPISRLGGVHVGRTVRTFIAALLKHLGLLEISRRYATLLRNKTMVEDEVAESDEQLRDARDRLLAVWRKGRQLHQWLVAGRQSWITELDTKRSEMEQSGTPMSREDQALEEHRSTYEGFCAPVLALCRYLLDRAPLRSDGPDGPVTTDWDDLESPSSDTGSIVAETLMLVRSSSSRHRQPREFERESILDRGQPSSNPELAAFRSLYQAYSALQQVDPSTAYSIVSGGPVQTQIGMASGSSGSLTDVLLSFVQLPISLSEFTLLLDRQRWRAQFRARVLSRVSDVLEKSSPKECVGLLSSFGLPFGSLKPGDAESSSELDGLDWSESGFHNSHPPQTAMHWSGGVGGAGRKARSELEDAFVRFLGHLARVVTDLKRPQTLRLAALRVFSMPLLPSDLQHVQAMGWVEGLSQLAHPPNPLEGPFRHPRELTDPGDLLTAVSQRVLFLQLLRRPIPTTVTQEISEHSFLLSELITRFLRVGERYSNALSRALSQPDSVEVTAIGEDPVWGALEQDVAEAEEALYFQLSQLHALLPPRERDLVHGDALVHGLCSPDSVRMLLSVLGILRGEVQVRGRPLPASPGSPRIRELAFTLLVRLLPRLSLSELESQLGDAREVLRWMLEHIGDLSLSPPQEEIPECKPTASLYLNWDLECRLGLSAQIVHFLRRLLGPEEPVPEMAFWRAAVQGEITAGLRDLEDLCEKLDVPAEGALAGDSAVDSPGGAPLTLDRETWKQFSRTMAVLRLLGGHTEQLRIGGKVERVVHRSTNPGADREVGTVVGMDRSQERVQVVFDHRPAEMIECEVSKLETKSPTVIPCAAAVSEDGVWKSLVRSFGKFIVRALHEDTLRRKQLEEEKQREEERRRLREAEEAERETLRQETLLLMEEAAQAAAEWACEICTFLNTDPHRTSCEMCGLPRPDGQTPEFPDWASPANHQTLEVSEDESGVEEKEQGSDEASAVDIPALTYYRLRAQSLKVLNVLLTYPPVAVSIIEDGLLPKLLEISVCPTSLESYTSLGDLDRREARLFDLLYDRIRLRLTDSVRFSRVATKMLLGHSPFADLEKHVPSAFDVPSAFQIHFLVDQLTVSKGVPGETIRLLQSDGERRSEWPSIVRANHLIPNSIPSYYFEVTIKALPDLSPMESPSAGDGGEGSDSSWGVAVGLFRSGFPLEGEPGAHNSVALSAARGELHQTIAGQLVQKWESGAGSWLRVGDTVGCGWNLRQNKVYFTRNGELLAVGNPHVTEGIESVSADRAIPKESIAFENVNGRFSPCVWIQFQGIQVKANFGQEPFLFPFEETLPRGYVDSLKKEGGVKKSERELARATQAEELVMMMGGSYPEILCALALERNHDNLELAANWLIENGSRELERIHRDTLQASANERIPERAPEAEDSEDESDLLEWLGLGPESAAAEPEDRGDRRLPWDVLGHRRGGGLLRRRGPFAPAGRQQQQQSASELLDDELEQDIPVGLEQDVMRRNARRGRLVEQQRMNFDRLLMEPDQWLRAPGLGVGGNASDPAGVLHEPIRIDDVHPGQRLTLSPSSLNLIADTYGAPVYWRTLTPYLGQEGVVTDLDINHNTVQMLFSHPRLGTRRCLWCPLACLAKPTAVWPDPCSDLLGKKLTEIARAYRDTEHALSLRVVRSAVLRLIAFWPRVALEERFAGTGQDPEFSLDHVGGAQALVDLLKLAGSDHMSTVLMSTPGGNRGAMEDDLLVDAERWGASDCEVGTAIGAELDSNVLLAVWRKRLLDVIRTDWNRYGEKMLQPVRLRPELYSRPDRARNVAGSSRETRAAPDELELRRSLSATDNRREEAQPSSVPQAPPSLVQMLVEETLLHFVQAVNHPPPVLTYRSTHPYRSHEEQRVRVSIPGSRKLLVTFDPRCDISTDMLTSLTFYRDSDSQIQLSRHSGSYMPGGSGRFESFLIPGDSFSFKFTAGMNPQRKWGFKFRVSPVELKINDRTALDSLNFPLGSWLFELFLSSSAMPPAIQRVYTPDMYEALVHYVIHAKPAAKSRGVALLTRLLLQAYRQQEEDPSADFLHRIDLGKLQSLDEQMRTVMQQLQGSGHQHSSLQFSTFQGLIELLAIVDLLQSRVSRPALVSDLPPETAALDFSQGPLPEMTAEINIRELGTPKLRVVNASYSYGTGNEKEQIDLAREISTFLETSSGGTVLVLPPPASRPPEADDDVDHNHHDQAVSIAQVFPTWSKALRPENHSVASSQKKLSLIYTVVTTTVEEATGELRTQESGPFSRSFNYGRFGPVQRWLHRGRNPEHSRRFVVNPSPTLFENVVYMSRVSLVMLQHLDQKSVHELPTSVLLSSLTSDAALSSYLPILGPQETPRPDGNRRRSEGASESERKASLESKDPEEEALSHHHHHHQQQQQMMDSPGCYRVLNEADAARRAVAFAVPDPVVRPPEFTLSLWLYLAEGPVESSGEDVPATVSSGYPHSVSSSEVNHPRPSGRQPQQQQQQSSRPEAAPSHRAPPRLLLQKGDPRAEVALGAQGHPLEVGRVGGEEPPAVGGFSLQLAGDSNHLEVASFPGLLLRSNRELPLQTWIHVVLVQEQQRLALFLDGALDAEQIVSAGYHRTHGGGVLPPLSPFPFWIGWPLPFGISAFDRSQIQGPAAGRVLRRHSSAQRRRNHSGPVFLDAAGDGEEEEDDYVSSSSSESEEQHESEEAGLPEAETDQTEPPPSSRGEDADSKTTVVGFRGVLQDARFYCHALSEPRVQELHVSALGVSSGLTGGGRHDPDLSIWTDELSHNFRIPAAALQLVCMQESGGERRVRARDLSRSLPHSEEGSSNPALSGCLRMLGASWSVDADVQLIELFNQVLERETQSRLELHNSQDRADRMIPAPQSRLLDLSPHDPGLEIPEKLLQSLHHLNSLDLVTLRSRFSVLQEFNRRLVEILPLIDFSKAVSSWSLAHRIARLSPLIFMEVKSLAWGKVLRDTNSGTTTPVILNRGVALRAQDHPESDPDGLKTLFGQLYRQLNFLRPVHLRTDDRPWRVTYQGEGGQDVGGMFRDSLSHVCTDLQSESVPLFIPCPNARGFGDNQEKFVPNPACKSSLHLSMFSFVGKLMGMAIRGRHYLNLDLPSVVWKPLVGQAVTREDIHAIDSLCFDVLDKIADIQNQNVTPESFTEVISSHFTTTSSDGREVPLKPNGRNEVVTWDNRHEFVQLTEQYRLAEFQVQVDAIRRGLGTIVPVHLLPLFTWQELERMVCGRREIDLEYLKAHTRYRAPLHPQHEQVRMFWEVLSEFTQEERQLFLRFIWGQSRLPQDEESWTQRMELSVYPHGGDGALPISHTCFFQLELPNYSRSEVMRDRLLYAINNCRSVDADFAVQDMDMQGWNDDDI